MKKICLILLVICLLFATACEQPTEEPEPTIDPHEGEIQVSDGNGGLMWVPEAENLTPFAPEAELFSVTDGDVGYSGDGWTLRRGIDVSSYQGDIDWQAVADSGVSFAIIRCAWRGYTSGTLNVDDRFHQNIEGALAAGLDVGIYIYSQAINVYEAAEEAIFTVDLIRDYEVSLPVFFDWELPSGTDVRTENVDGTTLTDCCLEFCRLIESAGYTPGVYTYINLAYFKYELNRLDGLTIWMANPGSQPTFYYDYTYWQYSFTGNVPGIEGETDLDVMFIPLKTEPAAEPLPSEISTTDGETP